MSYLITQRVRIDQWYYAAVLLIGVLAAADALLGGFEWQRGRVVQSLLAGSGITFGANGLRWAVLRARILRGLRRLPTSDIH